MTKGSGGVAAIDCGTNSTRLLVLDAAGERVARLMRITRLGAGVDRTGMLEPAAIDRTLLVLEEYRAVLDRVGVMPEDVRATATSATRDAANAADFLEPAATVIGVRPEVIEGDEEGRLSYAGATASLDLAGGPYLVLDIGGGSTELIVGGEPGDPVPAAVVSVDMGCVRASERFFRSDPPSPDELRRAREAIRSLIEEVRHGDDSWRRARQLVGLAGTVSAVTVLALGLSSFDETKVHHAHLSRGDVRRITDRLAAVPLAERRRLKGMEPERADVIVGGALVLGEVMDAFGFGELVASESDILDGIAFGLLEARAARVD